MSHYRIYEIDAAGRIFRGEDHEDDSDQAATDAAMALHPRTHLEVWQGDRLVRVLKPTRTAGAAG
jgi:hypothetical protein